MSDIKVSKEQIDDLLRRAQVTADTVYDKCTRVTVKLESGFILTESSACVDPANYDAALGQKICLDHIRNRLWELEGYVLQKRQHEQLEEEIDRLRRCADEHKGAPGNPSLSITVPLMESEDYKDRFLAECMQLSIRLGKLEDMLARWDDGSIAFTPDCPRSIYDVQVRAMRDYLAALEARAAIEGIHIPI